MKTVELALKAGRKRQSEITRFVHHSAEHPEKSSEVIPVYENFCFALALLRSRIAENVLEAKALLEKLLAFQVSHAFPVYLHEYPQCRYAGLGSKLYPVIFYILRDFQTVLGDKLRHALQDVLTHFSLSEVTAPETSEEWGEFLIRAQLLEQDKTAAFQHWDAGSLAFVGAQKQERGEPAVTLYDLFMGEWSGRFSARALQDHPVHLRASLIYPLAEPPVFSSPVFPLHRRMWGNGNPTHSWILNAAGSTFEEKESLRVVLPEKEVQEEIEIACFYNLHPETEIFINGQKANTFQLGDTVQLSSKDLQMEFSFELIAGEGQFWGHLYRSNRPGQLSCRGEEKHEAYDGIIALRTVKRNANSVIKMSFK